MATRRRRRRDPEDSPLLITAAVVVILLVLGGFGAVGWFYYQATKSGKLEADLCPATGPTAETAFLFDLTDPISPITKSDLMNQFTETIAGMKKGDLVEVYALTEDEGKPQLTFRGCNPGKESDGGWATNPKVIRERWKKSFEEPLNKVGDELGEGKEAKRSPIMAGVQRIVVDSFAKPEMHNLPKTLVIASDLIEHTDAFSNYRSGTDYKKFEASPANDRFRTDLEGVEVKLLMFERASSKLDSEALANFWAQWIVANHGDRGGVTRLMGVN